MGKKTGLGQQLYIRGYDVSGDVGVIDDASAPVELLDITGIDKSAMERIMGRRDGKLSFTAFFNPGTDAAHDALSGLPTADVLVLWMMGTTRGDACAALSAKQIGYDGTLQNSGALAFKVDCMAAAGFFLEHGRVLVAKITHASATDETGILAEGSAQTTAGAVGFLQHFGAADPIPTGTNRVSG